MGKPAGKIELAWYRINGAAPWGYIFLAAFLVALLGAGLADILTGTSGNGDTSSCPRGISINDNC